jgi:hypothetical protein
VAYSRKGKKLVQCAALHLSSQLISLCAL